MNKHDFPKIHFYDQDFVDIYNKSWNMLSDYWIDPKTEEKSADGYFIYPVDGKFIIDQFESISRLFFLCTQIVILMQTRTLIIFMHARKKTVPSAGSMT